jgi:hypothetical protein
MNKLFDLCLRIENILESNKKCVFVPAINVLSVLLASRFNSLRFCEKYKKED